MEQLRKQQFRFIGTHLTIVLAFLVFLVGTNLYYDHYAVLGTNMSNRDSVNLNQRHVKLEYMDDHKGEYNALLLGSSRVAHIDAEKMSKAASLHYMRDLNFYNLSVFSGGAQDFKNFAEYFGENHEIDHVVIGLDMVPFFNPPDLDKANFKHHYRITGQAKSSYYLSYLFQTSFLYLMTEKDYFFGDKPPKYTHNIETGAYIPAKAMAAAEADYDGYWEKEVAEAEKKAKVYQKSSYQLNKIQRDTFLALINYLDDKEISYDVFVNPLHPINRTFFGEAEHAQFNQMLADANISSLPNFDPLEEMLADNQNFYDLRHFKPVVGDEIIKNLYKPVLRLAKEQP